MLCPQVSKRQILADPSRCKILPKLIGLWVDQIDVLRSDGEICGFPNNEVNFPLISQLVMHVTQVYNLMMPGSVEREPGRETCVVNAEGAPSEPGLRHPLLVGHMRSRCEMGQAR